MHRYDMEFFGPYVFQGIVADGLMILSPHHCCFFSPLGNLSRIPLPIWRLASFVRLVFSSLFAIIFRVTALFRFFCLELV